MKNCLLVIAIALSLCACNNSSSDSKSVPAVPEVLTFSKPFAGPKLTDSQVKEIKAVFATKSSMMLPPGDLIYAPKSRTAEERAEKESELKKNDPRSYEFLKAIQANCNKGRPTTSINATFPTDGDGALNNLRTNDLMSFSSQAVLKEKSGCPVDFDATLSLGAKVEDINQDNLSGTISAGMNFNSRALALNSDYAKLLGKKGLVIQSSISGLASLLDTKGKGLLTFTLTGSYHGLETEVPFTMNVQVLSVGETQGKKRSFDKIEMSTVRSESVMNSELKMSNFTARIDVHQLMNAEGKIVSDEIYVNGHLTTREEFEHLFGTKNPAGSITNNSVVTTLN